jgi:hypothetical protein
MQRRENAVWDVLTIQAKGSAVPLWQEVSRADHRVCCLEWFQFQGENRTQLLYVESNCLKYATPCPGRVVVMRPDDDHVRQLISFDNTVVTTVLPIGHYLFTRSRRDPTEGVTKASSVAIYEWSNDAYHFVDQVELQRTQTLPGDAAVPPWGDDEGMAHDHEAPDSSLPPRRG